MIDWFVASYYLVSTRGCRVLTGSQGVLEWEIVVKTVPSKLAQLFGAKPFEQTFRGDCTVWSEYPSGRSVSILDGVHNALMQFWRQAKWERNERLGI